MGIFGLVVRPAGPRTLAGFTLGELLSRQVYGDLYRASGEGRRDARLLVVAPALASDARFSDALGRGTAPLLGAFHHRAVVGTILVARDGKELVIVTEGVERARTLEDVLTRARGRGLPPRIAATLARSVIDALATAHALGITHGALHPRSVLIDGEGVVRVTDFAVGFAAMAAAAGGSDAVELRGLGGYLAPELALGDEPSPTSDVYAIGAILFTLLSGTTPPGTLHATPAIERLVQRALDTDLHRRFASAIEVQENFAEALEDDRWDTAAPAELSHALAELAGAPAPAPDGNLDAATEDLLASLGGAEVTAATSAPAPAMPARARRASGGLDSLLDDLEEHTDGGLTTVEDERGRGQTARDPISELIEMVPAPAEPAEAPEPRARRAPALVAPDPTGETVVPAPAAAPAPAAPAADDAPAAVATAAPPPRRVLATPLLDEPPRLEPPQLGRRRSWLWAIVVLVAGAALAYGIVRQGKQRSKGEKEAAARREAKEREAKELEARLIAAKEKPGTIRIRSTPDYAGVWLLLGRSQLESISISTANVWEVRLELEGYQSQDVHVVDKQWTGTSKDDLKAAINVTLTPGVLEKPLPSMTPALPPGEVGRADGRGKLTVDTTPRGAAAYLLVGQTPNMELSGIAAGRDYEFKVLLDGYLPGYVRIAAEEWRDGGDPNLPLSAAPMKATIERSIELVPVPTTGKPR